MSLQQPFDRQLAKAIYLRQMTSMKSILIAEERRLGTRDCGPYNLYKRFIMDEFYEAMSDVFSTLEKADILRRCPCGTTIRKGYSKTCDKCRGAGWCNSDRFNELLGEDGPPSDILPL